MFPATFWTKFIFKDPLSLKFQTCEQVSPWEILGNQFHPKSCLNFVSILLNLINVEFLSSYSRPICTQYILCKEVMKKKYCSCLWYVIMAESRRSSFTYLLVHNRLYLLIDLCLIKHTSLASVEKKDTLLSTGSDCFA